MKSNVFALFMLSLCLFLFGVNHSARAENQALQQLLEIFEKRALISPEEVKAIRDAMAQDERRLLETENSLEEKRKALLEWEKELQEKEQALRTKEYFVSEQGKEAPGENLQVRGKHEEPHEGIAEGAAGEEPASGTAIPLKATYRDGFCLSSVEEGLFSLCLGGLLQTDYRHFEYDSTDPQKNKFDLRRVRLRVQGDVSRHVAYKF